MKITRTRCTVAFVVGAIAGAGSLATAETSAAEAAAPPGITGTNVSASGPDRGYLTVAPVLQQVSDDVYEVGFLATGTTYAEVSAPTSYFSPRIIVDGHIVGGGAPDPLFCLGAFDLVTVHDTVIDPDGTIALSPGKHTVTVEVGYCSDVQGGETQAVATETYIV